MATPTVPNSSFEVAEENLLNLDRLMNQPSGVVTNREGVALTPIPVINQQLEDLVDNGEQAVLAIGWEDKGTFAAGATLDIPNQIISNGTNYYRWSGVFPKVVSAGSAVTPIGVGGWLLVGDSQLRSEFLLHLSDPYAHPEIINSVVNEANRAEVAADAAALNAGIYPDITAGLAAVVEGSYFSTPSSNNYNYIDLYRKLSGSATLIKSYPSSFFINQEVDRRSGYIFAVTDAVGKMVIGVNNQKQLVVADKNIGSQLSTISENIGVISDSIAAQDTGRSGVIFGLLDSAGKLAFSLMRNKDCSIFGRHILTEIDELKKNVVGVKFIIPTTDLVFIGDSLTAGAGGQTTWREQLPTMLTGGNRVSLNYSIGGQTSSQIAARMGAIFSMITVEDNTLPSSGSVAITSRSINLLTNQGTQSIKGSLYGVKGSIVRATDDSYTFSRDVAGSSVYVPDSTPFYPDNTIGNAPFGTVFIFIGRNNLSSPEVVKKDIRRVVEWIKTQEKRFIVLTPTNGGPTDINTPSSEGTGTSTYNNIVSIEQWAEDEYGDLVFNVRKHSFQFANGSEGDNLDISMGVLPRSLRIDNVHFTTAFHGKIAEKVADIITKKGW